MANEGYGGNQKLTGKKETFQYTREQIEEIKKCRKDFDYFVNYCTIVHPDHGKIYFEPHDFQYRFASKVIQNRFVATLYPRQHGKCFTKDTKYRVRNKKTGEIMNVTAEEFHEKLKRDS